MLNLKLKHTNYKYNRFINFLTNASSFIKSNVGALSHVTVLLSAATTSSTQSTLQTRTTTTSEITTSRTTLMTTTSLTKPMTTTSLTTPVTTSPPQSKCIDSNIIITKGWNCVVPQVMNITTAVDFDKFCR